MEEEYESEEDSGDIGGAAETIREVNKDNVLNYESDSDDNEEDESDDLGAKMQE